MNPRIFTKKEDDEAALRAKVAANPEWQKAYAPAWDQIAAAYAGLPAYGEAHRLLEPHGRRASPGMASTIVRYGDEMQKPSAQRYPEFADARLEGLKFSLFSTGAGLRGHGRGAAGRRGSTKAQKALGADDPFIKAALNGQHAGGRGEGRCMAGTTLADPAARKALVEGGPAAIQASSDPLIALARRVEPIIRELRAWQEEKIQSVEAARRREDRPRRASPSTASPPTPTPTSTCASSTAPCSATRKTPRWCPTRPRSTGSTSGPPPSTRSRRSICPRAGATARARLDLADAVQLRLHRRHHRRQLRQPGHQPQRGDLRHQLRQQRAEAAEPLPLHRRGRRVARRRRPLGRHHRGPDASSTAPTPSSPS